MENIQGNDVNPPRSATTEGTAVARIVASMATRPMLSITASRMGPRSLRRPTDARLTRASGEAVTSGQPVPETEHSGRARWCRTIPASRPYTLQRTRHLLDDPAASGPVPHQEVPHDALEA